MTTKNNKPATKNTSAKGNTGKRYSPAFKKKVVDFVESAGRGGITEAQDKFKVSYIAIRSWLKKKAEPGAARSPGRPSKNNAAPMGDNSTLKGFKKMFFEMRASIDAARNASNVQYAHLEAKVREMEEMFA